MKHLKYKTITKRFLFWKYKKEIKDGWEDIRATLDPLKIGKYHKYCGSVVRLGRDKEGVFHYCPLCKHKVSSK